MITLEQVLTFGLAAFVLIAIPGPSVVFTIGRAIAYGRAVALATVVGNTLGLLAVVLLVSAGLGVVVQESIVVYSVLKLVGAAYLVWLGVQAIRRRRRMGDVHDLGGPATLAPSVAVRQGFVVGVSNPKAFMIIGAVLPQFVHVDAGRVPLQMVLLGLVAVVIGLLSDSVWALVASRLREWFAGSRRRGEALGVAGGVSMMGLGVALAFTGRDAPR